MPNYKRVGILIAIACLLSFGKEAVASGADSSKQELGLPASGPWKFFPGSEFPGASGKLEGGEDRGIPVEVLAYDFTKGGLYVSAQIKVVIPEGTDEIRVRVKSDDAGPVSLRLEDSTGQKLSIMAAYTQAGEWQVLRYPLAGKMRHYAGANDGRIHFPIKSLSLLVHRKGRAAPAGVLTFSEFQLLKSS